MHVGGLGGGVDGIYVSQDALAVGGKVERVRTQVVANAGFCPEARLAGDESVPFGFVVTDRNTAFRRSVKELAAGTGPLRAANAGRSNLPATAGPWVRANINDMFSGLLRNVGDPSAIRGKRRSRLRPGSSGKILQFAGDRIFRVCEVKRDG